LWTLDGGLNNPFEKDKNNTNNSAILESNSNNNSEAKPRINPRDGSIMLESEESAENEEEESSENEDFELNAQNNTNAPLNHFLPNSNDDVMTSPSMCLVVVYLFFFLSFLLLFIYLFYLFYNFFLFS
jgi:hypothetical protein